MNIEKETKNIAVFIDFENIEPHNIQLQILIDKLKEKGRLIVKKAYADWGRYGGRKKEMLESSIELIELPSHNARGKNSADIKLVVDALETVFTKDHINTYTIVSGDSDYIPLISKLREYNKYVIIISYDANSTNPLIKNYCDELIYYSSIAGLADIQKDLNLAYQLLIRTINVLEEEGIQKRGSQVKQHMKLLDSSFDESNFGFQQFKKFLERASKDKIINLQDIGEGDHLISLTISTEENNLVNLPATVENNTIIEHLVFWSIRANLTSDHNRILMGRLNETLREFNPSFNIINYNISKNRGFKGFIDHFFQQKGFLEIELNDKNETWLTPTSVFENAYNSTEAPDKFKYVRLKILLMKLGLVCNSQQIGLFYLTFSKILNQLEGKSIIIIDLLDKITKELSDSFLEEKFTPNMCKKIMNILIKNQNIKDAQGNPIEDINATINNVNLVSIEQVLEDFKELIKMEIEQEFNEKIEDETILEFLFSV